MSTTENFNILLLPELAQLLYEKTYKIAEVSFQNIPILAKKHSEAIRKTILGKYKQLMQSNNNQNYSNSSSEFEILYIIFSYFDFFVSHFGDLKYLFSIKNEFIYTILRVDPIIPSTKTYVDVLLNIKRDLSFCDLKSAQEKLKSLTHSRQESTIDENLIEYYKDIYTQLAYLLEILISITEPGAEIDWNSIISYMNRDFSKKIKDCMDTLKEIAEKSVNKVDQTLILTSDIIGIIAGDEQKIINDLNKKDIHLIICANVFYRFYFANFYAVMNRMVELVKKGEKYEQLITQMLSIDSNKGDQLFQLIQKLKGNFPFLLRFHMFVIMNDLDMLNTGDNGKAEYLFLFNNLIEINASFENFAKYMFSFIETEDKIEKIVSDYSIKCICKIIEQIQEKNNGENNSQINDIIQNNEQNNNIIFKSSISAIKKEIRSFKFGKKIIQEINDILFWKYLEKNYINEALEIYLDNYLLSQEESVTDNEKKLYKDQIITEKDSYFDHFLILFFENANIKADEHLSSEILNLFQEIREILMNKKEILPSKLDFTLKYMEFFLNLDVIGFTKDSINEIGEDSYCKIMNDFFEYCFIKKKCPSVMWISVLKNIKLNYEKNCENVDNFQLLNKEKCQIAWDNLQMYENSIKRKMKIVHFDNETINKVFDEMSDFLFDIKSQII